jgi:hypothetical protein
LSNNIEQHWQRRTRVTLATFLAGIAITSCASLPDSLSLAYPIRASEPVLNFKNTGQHCLMDGEVDDLSTYILEVRRYQKTTEAIIDSVNSP